MLRWHKQNMCYLENITFTLLTQCKKDLKYILMLLDAATLMQFVFLVL